MFEAFSKEVDDSTPLLPRHQGTQEEKISVVNKKANLKRIMIALVASVALLSLLVIVGFKNSKNAAPVTLLEEGTNSTVICDPNKCVSSYLGYCAKYQDCSDVTPTSMPTIVPSSAPT